MAGTTAATFATLCPKGFTFKVCSLSPANPKPKKLTRRYFVAHFLAKPDGKESETVIVFMEPLTVLVHMICCKLLSALDMGYCPGPQEVLYNIWYMYHISFLIIESFKKSEITVVSCLTSLSFSHAPSLSEVAMRVKETKRSPQSLI